MIICCGLVRETPPIGKSKKYDVAVYNRRNNNNIIHTHNDELVKTSGPGRMNFRVRKIMTLLEERYPPAPPHDAHDDDDDEGEFEITSVRRRDWKKTRNYLYNASSKILSIRQIQHVLDFLDQRFPKHLSRLVLQECPRILKKPVDSFLIPTADFLLELWGKDLFVQAIERNPSLLLTNGVGYVPAPANGHTRGRDDNTDTNNGIDVPSEEGPDEDNVEQLLMKRTSLSTSAIQKMKRMTPFIFGQASYRIEEVMDYMESILVKGGVKDPTKVLGKIVSSHPHVLSLSVETNLRPRIEFLSDSCQMKEEDVAKIVQSSGGSILGLSVERNLKPTIEYLLEQIYYEKEGNARDLLRKCLLAHPQVLGLGIPNLQAKVNFFRSIGESLPGKIATRCPSVLSLSLEQNIIPTVDFLCKAWGVTTSANKNGSCDNSLLQSMLHEYPNILTLSIEGNLKPTMVFFNKTGYTLLNKEWELVNVSETTNSTQGTTSNSSVNKTTSKDYDSRIIRGRYIAASLYNRLLPRWHFYITKRPQIESKISSEGFPKENGNSTVTTELKTLPLHLLVMASDEEFCEMMDFVHNEYLQYKEEAIPRLKFSSQFDTWLKTGRPIDL
jgi:hypothetical protein